MTEAEWLAADNPTEMLKCLPSEVSGRKLRLFACQCCRRHWPLLSDERSRAAVEVAELWVDGLVTDAELGDAEVGADQAKDDLVTAHREGEYVNSERYKNAARAANLLATVAPFSLDRCVVVTGYCRAIGFHDRAEGDDPGAADTRLCTVLRDILGNPFRPQTADPSWLTSTAVALAQGMYESRDFSPMPILADALQDAGCDSAVVLDHCRGPRPHVRGCWVVDLVLGKE